MLPLSRGQQVIVAAFLIVLMVVTRGHHFASVNFLPSASWAVFFLAGVYLGSRIWFPVLLGLAVALDVIAVYWGGVSSDCFSPAYGFLLPAYGSLWFMGRWYSRQYQFNGSTLLVLGLSMVCATAAATLFSSGGFYWFSGYYADPTLVEHIHRFIQYFPKYLGTMSFYIAAAAICHVAFKFTATLEHPLHRQS